MNKAEKCMSNHVNKFRSLLEYIKRDYKTRMLTKKYSLEWINEETEHIQGMIQEVAPRMKGLLRKIEEYSRLIKIQMELN